MTEIPHVPILTLQPTAGPRLVYSRIGKSCHFSLSSHSRKIPGWGWPAEAGVPVPPEAQEGCEKEEKDGQTARHHHKEI